MSKILSRDEVLALIVGQRIVAVEDAGWDVSNQWLGDPVFILENGIRIDSGMEPITIRHPYEHEK